MKRDNITPVLLSAVVAAWCLVFSFEVAPIFGSRSLQVGLGLLIYTGVVVHIWRGRMSA